MKLTISYNFIILKSIEFKYNKAIRKRPNKLKLYYAFVFTMRFEILISCKY